MGLLQVCWYTACIHYHIADGASSCSIQLLNLRTLKRYSQVWQCTVSVQEAVDAVGSSTSTNEHVYVNGLPVPFSLARSHAPVGYG